MIGGIRISLSKPRFGAIRVEGQRIARDMERAALEATDLASKKAQKHIQAKMRAVGLGKLGNAVGQTSAKRKRNYPGSPYGVIFARGGDDTLAGGALEAYSQGTTIRPKNGNWLAVPTSAIPRVATVGGRRRRLTPERYKQAGLEQKIGKLIYIPVRQNLALLVVRNVSLSPKTGQAKRLGKRKPKTRGVPESYTTVFILIKQTRRAKRFDKDQIVRFYADRLPDYMARLMSDYQRKRP